MLVYNDFSKKMSRHIQKVFIAFLKVFKLISMCTKFQVSIKKKCDGDNFTPTPYERL